MMRSIITFHAPDDPPPNEVRGHYLRRGAMKRELHSANAPRRPAELRRKGGPACGGMPCGIPNEVRGRFLMEGE